MPSIRPGRSGDRPVIADILRHTPEFTPVDVVVAEELLDCYLQDPKGSGYYAYVSVDEHDQATGYICVGPTPLTDGTWDLYWIFVSRGARNQGIGKALLAIAEEEARKAKGRMVLIETSSTRPYRAARHLYRRASYKLVARVRDFYLPGDDRLIYQKYIDAAP